MSNTDKFHPEDLDRNVLNETLHSLSDYYIPKRRLRIREQTLGVGGFGTVKLADLSPDTWFPFGNTLTTVAVKELRTENHDGVLLRSAVRLAREIKVWASCKHANILEFTGYYLSTDFRQAYLVSPYIANGNIKNYLFREAPSQEQRLKLVLGTIKGLAYLHTRKPPIVHGDLKSLNVLVTNAGEALLCDLGLAKAMEDESTGLSTSNGFKGTLRYTSPEVLNGSPRDCSSDIWAWGCLVLEIFTGNPPYHEIQNDTKVLLLICGHEDHRRTPEPSDISSLPATALSLLKMCWDFEPIQRPRALQCVDKVEAVSLSTPSGRASELEISTDYGTYEEFNGTSPTSPASSYHSLAETLDPQVVAFPDPANPNNVQEVVTGSTVVPSVTKIPVPDSYPATRDPVPFGLPLPLPGLDAFSLKSPLQPQLTGSSTHSSEGYISSANAPEAEEIIDAHTIQLESNPFALGGSADIYKGTWKPSRSKTNVLVAVKVLRFSGMSKEENPDYPKQMAKIDERLAREMFVWQKARHPNVTPLLGFMRSTNSVLLGDCPFLVSPYYRNGNMNVYLSKHPNADVLALLHQAAGGLNFLHTFEPLPIAHLDIKGESILINDAEEASICDFGVSRMMDELSTRSTTSNPVLNLSFAPPEILNGEKGDTTADAFAFGGLILQALSGKAPYYKWRKTPARIALAVLGGNQPQPADHPITRVSPRAVNDAWALMKRCWNKERSDRPTSKNIMDTIEDIKVLDLQLSQDSQ